MQELTCRATREVVPGHVPAQGVRLPIMLRTVLTLLLTPIVAALSFWLLVFLHAGKPDTSSSIFVLVFGYFVAFFLGIPAILIFRTLSLYRWWQYALFGGISALVPVFMFLRSVSSDSLTLSRIVEVIVTFWILPLSGMVAGAFFWFICGRPPSQT